MPLATTAYASEAVPDRTLDAIHRVATTEEEAALGAEMAGVLEDLAEREERKRYMERLQRKATWSKLYLV